MTKIVTRVGVVRLRLNADKLLAARGVKCDDACSPTSRNRPTRMSDAYLQAILSREAVDTGPNSPVRGVQGILAPLLAEWANVYLISVSPSGSFAKGTANHSGTDIDLFISLSENTVETLQQIYETLFTRLAQAGYTPKRQNVSINIRVNGYDVDLVPAKRQNALSNDHSLYRRKANTWTKTNVQTHITTVWAGGRQQESRLIKLWRDQKGLDSPSFYVELAVIEALRNTYHATLSGRVSVAPAQATALCRENISTRSSAR
ncbi:nucleotidyltransferase domain-containing protein [Rhizobium leguminosarum]|uniref:nucleotidyltransferase domain-containing protein n=1 Tax=Rhizobium leguminosarum TaxID=384 RepID=UPI001C928D7C|nr:nucleotidyltransferase domain-containing protein [Rhizobium leguminosarum]